MRRFAANEADDVRFAPFRNEPIADDFRIYGEGSMPQTSFVSLPHVSLLFPARSQKSVGLAEADYADAARELEVEVEAIIAVSQVETKGEPFNLLGRPKILFERHYFHRLTQGKYDDSHPDISQRTMGGYGRESYQYVKLEVAYGINPDAALRSASWGRFQIMGDNFRAAGYATVTQFVRAMSESESAQLAAFVKLIQSDKRMRTALREKNWARFAFLYNGRSYAENQYDTKMQSAYEDLVSARAQAKADPFIPAPRYRAEGRLCEK